MSTVQSEIEKKYEIYVKEHPEQLLQHLNSGRKESVFCDFVIKVGSKEIHVHRIILSKGCDYFRALFDHEMKESKSGVVEMKDVDPECMSICIEYIYTGRVSMLESKVLELLYVADMLQLPKLSAAIGSLFKTKLDADSFFTTRNLAKSFNLKGLMEHCNKYAFEKFNLLAVKEAFKDLEKEYVKLLIGAKETQASEAAKCKTLVSWTESDPESRSKVFEEVFLSFDLEKIPVNYRLYLSAKEPVVLNSGKCLKKLVQSTLDIGDMAMKDYVVGGESQHNAFAVFDKKSKTIQAFKPADKSWTRMHVVTDDVKNKDLSAVALDDNIIVLGNDKTNYRLNFTDPEPKWIRLPDRPENGRVEAVALHGEVYAFHNYHPSCELIEKLDIRQTTWSTLTKPFPCWSSALIAMEDFIYTFGGFDGEHISKAAKFCQNTSTWSNLPSMPTARNYAAAAAVRDKIYVMGGFFDSCLKTTEIFHIESQVWTTVKSMPNAHSCFKAFAIVGKIYAVGGHGSSNSIDEYDPDTDAWWTIDTMDDKDIYQRATISMSV